MVKQWNQGRVLYQKNNIMSCIWCFFQIHCVVAIANRTTGPPTTETLGTERNYTYNRFIISKVQVGLLEALKNLGILLVFSWIKHLILQSRFGQWPLGFGSTAATNVNDLAVNFAVMNHLWCQYTRLHLIWYSCPGRFYLLKSHILQLW